MDLTKKASVIIVTYNHSEYIENCVKSVLSNNPLEIIVVDNGSTDGTLEILETMSEVRVVSGHGNVGYGAGNNIGVTVARGEYVVILNPDTLVEENWLEELLKPLESHEKLVTTPKFLLFDGSKINGAGLIVHFTGLSFLRGLNADKDEFSKKEFVNGIAGECFAMRRDDYLKLKFDENLLAYNEDGEFSWRLKVNDFRILYVPESRFYHDYTLTVPPEKIYHLEKARYLILRKYFSLKQIFIIIPSLIIAEILTWGYAILKGSSGVKFKFRAFLDSLKNEVDPVECNIRNLLENLDFQIPDDQLTYSTLDKFIKRFANMVFLINYKLIVSR
ncbi:glycosyltransferase family 2 protein [Methanothermobacter sp.]|uniref:glycosyltransferase family 2 protein n=1 Tax=Methanothermobacter sp. TaxID=1884223 RepID=UPI002601DCAB|nr:glycosyltransferase family 2 protein [Methanothermobacter sp.]MDI9615098.1 glycosyltransferase family 2 protein [Methanothermobacter sp.]